MKILEHYFSSTLVYVLLYINSGENHLLSVNFRTIISSAVFEIFKRGKVLSKFSNGCVNAMEPHALIMVFSTHTHTHSN